MAANLSTKCGRADSGLPVFERKKIAMLSPRTFALTFTTTACLSALAAFAFAAQEYLSSTCAAINCNNCGQALEVSSRSCPANVPNRCYGSKNSSTAGAGNWCSQSGSQTPPNCSWTSTGGTINNPCGELDYWNCGCIVSGQACNFCPCTGTKTGSWTPTTFNTGTCVNL
jgi:hypothetical protein